MDIFGDDKKGLSLREQTVTGVKWSGFARASQQILRIIITAVLARLLMPEDFGVLAMIAVFTGLIAIFNDLGIGSVVIQKQDLTDDFLSSIFWFNVCVGLFITLFAIAISPLIARFYNKDIIAPLLSLMSLGFFLSGLSNIQQSLLVKGMNFRKIAIFEIFSTLLSGVVAINMAYQGFGVWSLAWQGLSASIITCVLLWTTSHWKPKLRFNINSVKSIMGFSLNLLGFNVINYFSRNVDYLLIGKFLGSEPLGYYALAYRLILYPLQNISGVISRVLFPAFSFIQKDHERFRHAYLKATKYIAFITFPMMFGLFAIADEFVLTIFGSKWTSVIFLLKILCFVGMFQSIATTVGQIYLAKGKTDWMFKWTIFATAVIICAVSVGLLWGIKGVAVAYAIAVLILFYPNFAIPFRLIELKMRTFLKNFKSEISTGFVMFIVVFISVLIQRKISMDATVILFSNILLGIIIYIIAAKLINTDAFNEIKNMAWKKNCSE